MPPQNRVWCHDRLESSQHPPPERLAPHGQSPSLIIGEPQTLLAVQFTQDAILFLQVIDRPLFLVHPMLQSQAPSPEFIMLPSFGSPSYP